ncbi:MAG: hypothetical protein HGA27_05845 [Peptococcaceae bacterium]|nr:hypothetical protein [Peptococcaceae bacterium]
MTKKMGTEYNPLYFLAALGNGGMVVAFFMYPMFMLKHPGFPVATYSHVFKALTAGGAAFSALMGLAVLGILYFAFNHFKTLFWNLRQYSLFKKTGAFTTLKNSNAEVTLMAIPLTLAMSINVLFTLGAVFVPNLWNVVEYLFPFSILAFMAVGAYSLKIYLEYFNRIITKGDFDFLNNNSLSQLLAIFSFAMISVGFAGPAAMTHNLTTSAIAMFFSIMFGSITLVLAVIKLVIGFKSIFKHSIAKEAGPTLWIVIPIITVLGIAFVRIVSGISHNFFHHEPSPVIMFVALSSFVSIQILFGLIGYRVLKNDGYFREYIHGDKKSAVSYALICPGVASFVMGMFFIHWGLVKTNILPIFSPIYFLMLLPLVYIQIITIRTNYKLNKKML